MTIDQLHKMNESSLLLQAIKSIVIKKWKSQLSQKRISMLYWKSSFANKNKASHPWLITNLQQKAISTNSMSILMRPIWNLLNVGTARECSERQQYKSMRRYALRFSCLRERHLTQQPTELLKLRESNRFKPKVKKFSLQKQRSSNHRQRCRNRQPSRNGKQQVWPSGRT